MRCERVRAALIALVALVGFAGCQTGATCIRHSDCASGLVCGSDNLCAAPPDATPPDGEIADASRGDAALDAGAADPLHRDEAPAAAVSASEVAP